MRNKDLDLETVLSPAYLQIWENSLLGVMILDKEGLILYVNKILSRTDDLLDLDVIGKPMTSFYAIQESDHLSIQAIKTGKPILKKTVIYYTIKKKLVNSLCSSFPLISKGKIDGVIHFSLNLQVSQNLFASYPAPKKKVPLVSSRYAVPRKYTFDSIIGKDTVLNDAIDYARANSRTDFPALIWAETGCGKELFAQAIHYESTRAGKPFIPINCAAIPENLLETTLFGTAKGAFTGAIDKSGLIEKAEGGTLLLDELNSMSLDMQAKLLRVVQEKKIRRVGAHREKPFDVKFISTCNIPPSRALEENKIRLDLFYRLAVVVIEIPTLKSRKSDIALLCSHFLEKWTQSKLHVADQITISDEVYAIFNKYHWPGNVRELEHTLASTLTSLGTEKTIYKHHLSSYFIDNYEKTIEDRMRGEKLSSHHHPFHHPGYMDQADMSGHDKICLKTAVDMFEKKHIEQALTRAGYNISKAGRLLNLSSQSLRYKINKLNIQLIND
ncbi:sigma-54 interaction domain-containing protein [Desulforhopalus singaporensis]|uniref:Arginine utilization regulatory protein n=1 Tax=Desulforhopalus singaporensis TaxID=91360 RepID=A0A1H0SCF6_9BACT|nr:sigma 54-interacting transcriptional regulator [Desulforhopalus singaporensis]SDP38898.1 arginine utilization regulatory protein [Desulforhopalus singaporensis]